ncbi:alpha/beta fold hydrolase [Halomicronema sp. CCY15110]|uniref:alpha/beta fold hydrolase n=1 Tax=Halomicronema sp. CCY15110 TaxID=2767773 RepID=UPI00194F102B|nr:alpha/beta hydrolase [Halomicronema sp. CCY15110]
MHRQTLSLQDYTVAYSEQGQGTPLIFLHGFLGNGSNWQFIIPELQSDYRCVAIDLLGFGNSSKPRLRYTIWHQVDFLRQFIQALDLQHFHLVGHSYGGWTAAAYALAATGLGWTDQGWSSVASRAIALPSPATLTLIAAAGIRDDSFVGRYNHLRPLLWETPWVDWGLNAIAPVARIFNQQSAFQQIHQTRRELLNQPVAKSFLMDRLRPEDAIDTVDPYLQRIKSPTQVVAGQQDTTIPLWHSQTYAEKIPLANLKVIAEADHDLIHTHGAEIAQLIHHQVRRH